MSVGKLGRWLGLVTVFASAFFPVSSPVQSTKGNAVPWVSEKAIVRYQKLGVDSGGFLPDSVKPNCLAVYPQDESGNKNAFYNACSKEFLESLREVYDVTVVVAEREEEVYAALRSTPNIELLILGGHGNKTSLSLGDILLSSSELLGVERYSIDMSDDELSLYVGNLERNAVIFLDSCSNGEGGFMSKNLANKMMQVVNYRTVFSSTVPFACSDIHVRSWYPLDLWIGDTSAYYQKRIFKDLNLLSPDPLLFGNPAELWNLYLAIRDPKDVTYTNQRKLKE